MRKNLRWESRAGGKWKEISLSDHLQVTDHTTHNYTVQSKNLMGCFEYLLLGSSDWQQFLLYLICLSLPPPVNVNVKIYMCVVNCEPFWLFKDFNPSIALLNYPGKRRNCLRWKLSWKLITQGEWIRAPIEFISNLEN